MSSYNLIRLSSYTEIESLVDLACKTWISDPYFTTVIPGLREHPDEYRKIWSHILHSEGVQASTVFLVICKDSFDVKDAVGFCMWRRHGSSEIAQSWNADSISKSESISFLSLFFPFFFFFDKKKVAFSQSLHSPNISPCRACQILKMA